MSAFKKFLFLVLLLAVTNLLTYGYTNWKAHQESRASAEMLADSRAEAAELQQRLDDADAELERLSVVKGFTAFQEDLEEVNGEVDRLNFGNAIAKTDAIIEELHAGAYGEVLREAAPDLAAELERAKDALGMRSDEAGRHLLRTAEQALGILMGISADDGVGAPAETAAGGEIGDPTLEALPESPPAEPSPTGGEGDLFS